MKVLHRLLAVLGAALALAFVAASAAFADEGPHGRFGVSSLQSNTDKCAGCHRAHTALSERLLTRPTVTELCQSCHGSTASGADTNVWDGVFVAGRDGLYEAGYLAVNATVAWLNGGGFFQAYNVVGGRFSTVTSRHAVAGLLDGGTGLGDVGAADLQPAFGGGTSGPAIYGVLECTSCHDPHGSRNYRLLNKGLSASALDQWTPEAAFFLQSNVYSDEVVPAASGGKQHDYTAGTNVAYDRGISDFCASCHTSYLLTTHTAPGGQVYDAGDGKGALRRFRHPVSSKSVWDPDLYGPGSGGWDSTRGEFASSPWVTPGAANRLRRVDGDYRATNGTHVTCLTCHFAHGSSAVATGYAQSIAPMNGSALLFLDNRGVCQSCHDMPN